MTETNPSQAQDLAKSILVNEEETNQTAVEEEPAIDEPVEDIGTGDDTNVDTTEDQASIEIEEPQEETEPLYDVKVDGEVQKWTLSQLQQSASGQGYLNKRMQETATIRKQAEEAYQQVQKQRAELDVKLKEYTAQFNNVDIEKPDISELEKRYAIKDVKGLKLSGGILGLVIIGFFLHPVIHIAVSWVALGGAVIMLLATSRHDLEESLEEVEWTTLLFFAGLFVLVHSLQYMGVIDYIGNYVKLSIEFFSEEYRLGAALLILLWVSAIVSAFIDNIPYTATMIPIVFTLAIDLNLPLEPLIWALAFGACLGGNGTLIGASANVVTAGIAEEAGYPISFNEFFKAGFPVMILTTFIVSFYMILVYVVGANGGELLWKSILVGITLIGIIVQYLRGRSKGKSPAEALVDDDAKEIISKGAIIVGNVKNKISKAISEQE